MSKSRNFRKIALLLLVLSLAGCRERQPRGPESEQFLTAGTRIVLQSLDGQILFKVRERTTHFRVYDDSLRFVGRVRRNDTGVRVERLTGEVIDSSKEDKNIALPGLFRLEPMESEWAVFDAETRLVGYIGKDSVGWHFKRKWGDSPVFTARSLEAGTQIVEGSTVIATSLRMSPPMALAGRVADLEPLARVALALLLEGSE